MSNDEQIEYLLSERREIIAEQDMIKEALDSVNEQLMRAMESDHYETDYEKATIVRPKQRIEYDWKAIRDEINDDDIWDDIQVKTPSKDLLDRAVADRKVRMDQIITTTKPAPKSYLKITKKK